MIAAVTDNDPEPAVRLERDGPLARITLDRPERHNALRAHDVAALRGMLEQIDADDAVRVLVLTGSGDRTFCSGAALEQMRSGEMSGEVFDTLTDRLAGLRVPTIGRLNGSAYGGGAELALCCDFRVGTPDMRLLVPAARLGVCYPVGGLTRYVRRLGPGAAARILLAAEELGAQTLRDIGYLTHLVERGALDATVDELADRIASHAPLAVQAMKRLLLDLAAGSVDRDEAARLIARCAESEDLAEGLAAWEEGRTPEFRGR
jgi:enoyl-CoA hydratase